ncbi:MAG: DUF262 domain-containing protein, partial [Sphingobacteriales bacterium]
MLTNVKELNVQDLLSGEDQYIVPNYQRNYAWGAAEIGQLIQDIIDYFRLHPNKDYYLGTLVVAGGKHANSGNFQTIDGQQRITTLSILSSLIKNEYSEVDLSWFGNLNLRYASRDRSTLSMQAVFKGDTMPERRDNNIFAAYDTCRAELKEKLEFHEISVKDFADYLFKYVKILRVPLPGDTDLNRYFEIMNSRGE